MSFTGGNIPSGKFTRSDEVYVREWRRYGRCVERALADAGEDGWKMCAFDPGVQLMHKSGRSMESGIPRTIVRVLAVLGGWEAKT